jgi:NADPH:quinone reductase-like Zn-dependent oxidoreductase
MMPAQDLKRPVAAPAAATPANPARPAEPTAPNAAYRGWRIARYGGPDRLVPVTGPVPVPGPGEVAIAVVASAVTRADTMMRQGRPAFARPFLGWRRPKVPLSGTGFSGVIAAVGPGVTRFSPGMVVFGEAGMRFGANASHLVLAQGAVILPKPAGLAHEDAAVMCDGPLTSAHFLCDVARLRPGERVLILGGAGSLGSAAVQIAAAMGADVSASASPRNAELLRDLGAARIIDRTRDDPLRPMPGGYDVIFDTLGVARAAQARRALARGGRYVCPVLTLRLLATVAASRLWRGGRRAAFSAAGLQPPEAIRATLDRLLGAVAAGDLTVLRDRVYPLDELPQAQAYVETGRKRGNVVVIAP